MPEPYQYTITSNEAKVILTFASTASGDLSLPYIAASSRLTQSEVMDVVTRLVNKGWAQFDAASGLVQLKDDGRRLLALLQQQQAKPIYQSRRSQPVSIVLDEGVASSSSGSVEEIDQAIDDEVSKLGRPKSASNS